MAESRPCWLVIPFAYQHENRAIYLHPGAVVDVQVVQSDRVRFSRMTAYSNLRLTSCHINPPFHVNQTKAMLIKKEGLPAFSREVMEVIRFSC